jgi:hypothetical protein
VLSAAQKRHETYLHRRDAPSNILMTLYARAVDGTESSSNALSIPASASIQRTAFSSSSITASTKGDAIAVPSNSLPFGIAPDPGQSHGTVQGGDSTYSLTQTVVDAGPATTVSTVLFTTLDSANSQYVLPHLPKPWNTLSRDDDHGSSMFGMWPEWRKRYLSHGSKGGLFWLCNGRRGLGDGWSATAGVQCAAAASTRRKHL